MNNNIKFDEKMNINECIFKHKGKIKKLPENQIFTIPNFISEEDCNYFIDIINKHATQTEIWGENQNVSCHYINSENISNPPDDPNFQKNVDDKIYNYINKFINILNHNYDIISRGDSGYCLRKIYGPTRFHSDGINVTKIQDRYIPLRKIRNMSVIIALNDDYEGGIFHFPHQNFTKKLGKGELIAFPPYWTHLHGVETPLNNTIRYTINTWLFE